jgi:AraC-like DNA-binding protein
VALLRTTVFESRLTSVVDVRCDGHEGPPTDEVSDADVLVLPRRGVFTVAARSERVVADTTRARFLDEGDAYRVSHSHADGDASTVIRVDRGLLEEVGHANGYRTRRARGAFPTQHSMVGPATDYLHRRLVWSLGRADVIPPIAVEDAVLSIVGGTLSAAGDRAAYPPRTVPSQAAMVARVQEMLNERVHDNVTLHELAREVGASPYHLSRTFNRLTGLSIRTYVKRLRIRAAIDRLLAGERSLTTLAHDLGFADHSHLTRSLRRELGLTPREMRLGGTDADASGWTATLAS